MDGVELCDRKRQREENPQDEVEEEEAPPSPPPPGDNNNKKKHKKRGRHKNEGKGNEVYPNHPEPVSLCPTPISITASLNNNDESVEPNIMKPILNEDAHESAPIELVQPLSRSQLRNIKKARQRKNKKMKKTESVLKTEGEDLHKDVETPVQRTKGLTVKKVAFSCPTETSAVCNKRKYNAKSPVQTRCPPRTDGVKVTEPPVKRHAESYIICRACRQHGHKSEGCPRLKFLSKDEEICFFCGEIGHSLGKCSVSTAGGGRFAKCLFCYAQGHLSINCPQNGYRTDPKVAAAKWSYQQNSAK